MKKELKKIFQKEVNKGEQIREIFRQCWRTKLSRAKKWQIEIIKEELNRRE